MEGIIGQITAQVRVRRLKKKFPLTNVTIFYPPSPPMGMQHHLSIFLTSVFPSFEANLHNNYVWNKIRNSNRLRQE